MGKGWGAAATAAGRARSLLRELDAVRTSPGVRRVHQTRVACRRLAQSISVLRPHLPKALRKDATRAVKAIRKYFGPCRDADVLLQRLHVWLSTHPPDHQGATAAAELVAQLAKQRRQSTRRLLTALRSKAAENHARAIYALFSWCAEGGHKKKGKKKGAAVSGVDDVRRTRAQLGSMLEAQALDTTPAGLHHAHQVRICVKTLRYGVESLTRDEALQEPFRAQQDALGSVQDSCVLLELIDNAIQATPERPAPGLEHLSKRSGLSALRTDVLASIGGNFVTFREAHKRGEKVLDSLL